MSYQSTYERIISGRAGAWAGPARGALSVAAKLYGLAVGLRNRRYDRRGPRAALPVPVISVGNITAGGTGKTPLVIHVVRHLERMGLTPAVVSRGYMAVEGEPNDEERVIRRNCPSVVCLADADRARAGEVAHARFGADVIVLDDGFQHRRLARALDIVAVDATCPFGHGRLLPRGLLREPIHGLRRADVIALTRCDQTSPAELSRLEARLRKIAVSSTIVKCSHRVTGIERIDGTPFGGSVAGRRVVLFAGIGRPQAFSTTVRSLGVEVVDERWWPDHHRYRVRDLHGLLRGGDRPRPDMFLTTEKDAAKLVELKGLEHADIFVVKIVIDFVGDDGTIVQRILDETVGKAGST